MFKDMHREDEIVVGVLLRRSVAVNIGTFREFVWRRVVEIAAGKACS